MILKDVRLRWLLLAALVVQLIICITAIGSYHPDQHFQIIEFSTYQLHEPSAAEKVWELPAHLRSTIQVYLFSGYYEACTALGIRDPYVQLELLRVLFGLTLFVFFNGMALAYFKRPEDRRTLFVVLLLLNFTWILPYTRTLFSSEMLSSLLFFGAVWIYMRAYRDEGRRSWWPAVLTGFLFSLAFYVRFQTAFFLIGFAVWMIWPERQVRRIWPLAVGFLIGAGLNTVLDYAFYHQWVFTPYIYYRVNILEGKASSMGTSSFLVYLGVLAAVVLAPPFSIFLLTAGFRTAVVKKFKDPLVFSVICFIAGHCLVAHKEERFLFPIVNILPIFVGWGLPGLREWIDRRRGGVRALVRGTAWFSIGLNSVLLIILLFTPYSQMIYFTWQLDRHFGGAQTTIYTLGRTPFETEHQLPYVFYERATPNLRWRTVPVKDSLRRLDAGAKYITTTYNDIDGQEGMLDSLGYERVLCSSRLLWNVNEFLHSLGMNTINDIWVLYVRKMRDGKKYASPAHG